MKKVFTRMISADSITPVSAYAALAEKGNCILESAQELKSDGGRFSFIGVDPYASLFSRKEKIEIVVEGLAREAKGDPFQALKDLQRELTPEMERGPLSSFTGGAVGFVSYDAVRLKEKIPEGHGDVERMPDLFFQFYRSSVVFDHRNHRAVIATLAESKGEGDLALDRLQEKLYHAKALPTLGQKKKIEVEVDLSDEEFQEKVREAKEYLVKGDAFQIVISRTFRANVEMAPFQIYRALRQLSPSPYLYFFDLGEFAIAGASPEKIISVQDGIIESIPIAGTRPRGTPPEEMLNDPKEISEHVMLVDLARNDIGSIAVPGTVQVLEFKQILELSHVMHIISRVVGKLDPAFDAIDAFKASFPAGTLTGAPKVRAMEIIDKIEASRRGLYGGAIVALDPFGNLASCIAIRTAVIRNGIASVRAGAGIVLESDPQKEAEETRQKASALLEAFELAAGAKS